MTLNEVDQRIQALRNGLTAYAPHLAALLTGSGIAQAPYGIPQVGAPGIPPGLAAGQGIPPGLAAAPGLSPVATMGLRSPFAGAGLPPQAYPGVTPPAGAGFPLTGIPFGVPPAGYPMGTQVPSMYPGVNVPGVAPHLNFAPGYPYPAARVSQTPFATGAPFMGSSAPWSTAQAAPFANPMGVGPVGATHPFGSAGSLASGSEAIGNPASSGTTSRGPGNDMTGRPPVRTPTADLFDDGKTFTLQLEMPGVRKEDVELVTNDRFLSIRGVARTERPESELVFGERGGTTTTYMRTIPLPSEVQTGKVRATFRDGILSVVLPKRNPTEGARKVEIESTSV